MEKIEDLLDLDDRLIYAKALLDLTENKEMLAFPASSLSLLSRLLERVSSKRYAIFLAQIPEVKKFVFDQFRALWEKRSTEFHRIVEIPVLFNLLHSIQDQEVLNFLADKVQQTPDLRWRLLMWIERSKTEEVQTQAANAMTLLVKAGVSLSGKDFRGTRVPGADLSYGVFDSTLFQGADLSHVNLRGAWLREVNFTDANLDQACFGETMLASAKDRALPQIQSASLQQALKAQAFWNLAFSPDSQRLAVGCDDDWIRLWSLGVNPPKEIHSPSMRHTDGIKNVAFSPDGGWLASSDWRKSVCVWSAASGKRLAKIDGFVGSETLTVRWWKNDQESAFQDNAFLVTGGPDQAIRFWRVIKTDNEHCQVSLHWASHQTRLTAAGASIEGVRNLSPTAQKLLIRYGAQDSSASVSEED
ncbi:pentapeptide repeat-containing protein [Mycoavidus sp. B2-EB]|uniref:WD40 repeat domain-containing protein n=1 Tax=Mycoavidus sp. B2-EB TaxID=2651972 RepID=UPI0016293621|nr:pentapeptide repeat-containing protein [Mycoavidus sp. B2-EB]BBO59870.1 hypothetical protein MPB2EB_0997 [Mycoavidus sp. B2-EB]